MDNISLALSDKHLHDLLAIAKIGTWDWDMTTGKVIYSTAWAEILGYRLDELPQTIETWERMVLPEDLHYAKKQIEQYLSSERHTYEAEFRMVCKDGSIIWAQDKGKVIEYTKDGKPVRLVGVLQDVSRLKNAELRLRENQDTLDLAVNVAGLGTWDWDIAGNTIKYNDEYLHMLGYSQSDMNGSLEEWESMNHPEDLPRASKMLDKYLSGKIPSYECEIRMKHKNGSYIWTRDVGRIVARDADGKPLRLLGGHLNIDAVKRSEEQLTEALEALEHYMLFLENEIDNRTEALIEHDKMLFTVNQISRELLTFNPHDDFDLLMQQCLRLLGEATNKSRVYIWKDRIADDGEVYCTQIYEWVRGATPIQGEEEYEGLPYRDLPSFVHAIDAGKCLNSLIRTLSEAERAILEPQGIKTILIAPVKINGKRWGFVGIDNCETEQLFTGTEETMLSMSGSLLGSTIEKMETEAKMREMEERNQLMLNATPLCCNLWTEDFQNMSCNDEAVRLFGLSSQQEYLDRFYELSPEYQPCGRRSDEMALEYIKIAFSDGYCRFEWLHQKLDGTPVPAEVILVRIKYKEGFIVAGYTRDLRELKAMLAELQAKEDDLRSARDEALLSSKAKSNFLANMSHEIRTPMNAISGLAEIILRESIGRKSAEHAKGIKSACSNLLNIVNDILDISKIESGKLEIINSQYELSSLLNDVITISRMRLGDKPLMFVTDIDSRLPARLVGDEIRIKQILINLLSNAIKFTQEGHIALRVWGSVEADKAELCFSVTDTGTGIRQEDIDRLFAEFERVNTTKNRNIEGTGLGLAISKQLCEMMNGTIEVQSTYGKGSVFTAKIPQGCPEYQQLSKVDHEKSVLLYEPRELYLRSITSTIENLDCKCVPCANQSELYENLCLMPYDYILTSSLHLKKVQTLLQKKQMTVSVAVFADYGENIGDDKVYAIFFPVNCLQMADMLNGQCYEGEYGDSDMSSANFTAPSAWVLVVDDNPVNLKVAAGLMEPYQFVIDTAANGIEAVEKVKKNKYDLVFMDHMMPEMDGIDATAAIRQLEGEYYSSLPIIALTANALVGTREMFISEGMNDFLAKPIEINKLGHVLSKWLPSSKKIKTLHNDRSKPKSEGSEWDISGVNTAQGIASVGGNRENYLQILSVYYADGNQKCSSLLRHFNEKNIAAFRTEVHALKSTSATIGANELSAMSAKLEAAAQNQDIHFIDGNLDRFLASFRKVLDAIRPVVSSHTQPAKNETLSHEAIAGDLGYLCDMLDVLYNAAELVNISQLEDILGKLQSFSWPDEISKELSEIQNNTAMFDYDGVLECVMKLKKQIK